MSKHNIQIHGDYDVMRLNEMVSQMKKPLSIEIKPLRVARSLSQNALFHLWCGEMAEQFTIRERYQGGSESKVYYPDEIKSILKHLLLGYEDIKIGKTTIKGQLKSTSGLDVGEMHHFLTQVDAWGVEHGVQLTYPDESEYAEIKRKNNSMA